MSCPPPTGEMEDMGQRESNNNNTMREISQEIKDYIKAHVNDRPRTALARKLGISKFTLMALIHEYGGEVRNMNNPMSVDLEKLKELYPVMPVNDIVPILGVRKNTIYRWVKRLNLQRSPEGIAIKEANKKRVLDSMHNEAVYAKISKSMRKTYRLERMRVINGLPKKTKLRVAIIPRRTTATINRLCRMYNYFHEVNEDVLYYDSETTRMPLEKEKHYTENFHIKFAQADE